MTATLCGRGGVRAVIAENLLLKQQLIVLRRPRQRAPRLTASDRLLFGFGSLFLSPRTNPKGRHRRTPLRRSWRFIRRWCVARTADCSRRASARRNPDPRGRARHSSRPSSSSSREILGSAVHGLRASSRERSGSTSIRTSCTACCQNTIAPSLGGTGPSWVSFIGHTTDSLWSVDLFRGGSIVLWSDWVLVVMDQFTRRLVGVRRAPRSGQWRRPLPHVQRRHAWSGCPATSQHRS